MTGLTVIKAQPVARVVDILKTWLADAESGKLQSVVIVGESSDGDTYYAMRGDQTMKDKIWLLESLKFDLMQRYEASKEPTEG